MGLEIGTFISDLVVTNPLASDLRSQGDDHLRLIKAVLKATFPNLTGAVTSTQSELNGGFPTGTKMGFFQAAAPTGWVQDTSATLDHAIRVVPGAGGGYGGSVRFTTAFNPAGSEGLVGYHTLTVAELPPHTHIYTGNSNEASVTTGGAYAGSIGHVQPKASGATGSGAGHRHPLKLDLQYVNMIMAVKS